MQPIPFFPPRTLAYTLPQQKSMFLSCDDPATLCALKNVNKIKLRGVMHTLGFFLELTALMPRLGQAPMSLSIAQRENIACLNLP